jgi:signal peptidase II
LNAPENQKKNIESEDNAGSSMSPKKNNDDSGVAESNDISLPEVSSSRGIPHLLLIMSFIAAVDQFVKAIVVHNLRLHESIPVLPGVLTITRIHNSGIAFGLFPGMPDIFMVVTLISMLAVLYFYLSVHPRGILLTIGCSLIMGGALGNLIDRFRLKYVVDFIYFSFWPAFNVADSAVTIGVALLMITFFRNEKGVGQDAPGAD